MNISFHIKNPLFLFLIVIAIGCNNTPSKPNPSNSENISKHSLSNSLTDLEVATGWELLFDGKSAEHWRGYNRDAFPTTGWGIDEEGNLFVNGTGGDLITKRKFENFEFKVDFMVSDTGNSGIFYRVLEVEGEPIWYNAPEYQILDNETYRKMGNGNIEKHATGENYDLHSYEGDFSKSVGEWNSARIIILNNHVEHWLNGERIIEYKLESKEWKELVKQSKFRDFPNYGKTRIGHLGLQDHGYLVKFRNIKIREM